MRRKKILNLSLVIIAVVITQMVYLNYKFANQTRELADIQYKIEKSLDNLKYQFANLEGRVQLVEKRSFVNTHRLPETVTFCGDTLDLTDPVMRERLEREFYVLLGSQAQIQLYLKRTQKFLPMISRELKKSGLPDDLKYLAVHESALLPNIHSHARAVGIWQFMRATGRLYKLKINRYVDERRDPEKATHAASRFLKDLYKKFNDWPLAMAAYNAGQGRVVRSMRQQKVNSFFDLWLPEETERYFFKIVATKIILTNAGDYGFQMQDDDYFKTPGYYKVKFTVSGSRMPLQQISQMCNMPLAQFKSLNPALVKSYLPVGNYTLNIPYTRYTAFSGNYKKMRKGGKSPETGFRSEELLAD